MGKIVDWAVYGSVAYSLWTSPITTGDIDILVPARTADERERQVDAIMAVSNKGVLAGVPIEVYATALHPLYADALEHALRTRVGGEPFNVVPVEHLILMAIVAWRDYPERNVDDRQRASNLSALANTRKLHRLVMKYAKTFPRISEETIWGRLRQVTLGEP